MKREEILKRIEGIEKTKKNVNMFTRVTESFISKEAEIRPLIIFPGFCLDNDELYIEALEKCKEDVSKIIYNIFVIISYMVQKFGALGNEQKRSNILLSGEADEDGMITGKISINKFVGADAALCCERAAFFHNCMKLLGYNNILIFGQFQSEKEKIEGNHAYCVIDTPSGNYGLVDVTNYSLVETKNEYIPTIYRLTAEEFEGIKDGAFTFKADVSKHLYNGKLVSVDWQYS